VLRPGHGLSDRVVVGRGRGATVLGGRRGADAAGRREGGRTHADAADERGQRGQHRADGRVRRPAAARPSVAGPRRAVGAAGARRRRRGGRTEPHACVAGRGRRRVRLPQVRTADRVGQRPRRRRERVRQRGRRVAAHHLGGRQLLRDGHFRGSRDVGQKVSTTVARGPVVERGF